MNSVVRPPAIVGDCRRGRKEAWLAAPVAFQEKASRRCLLQYSLMKAIRVYEVQ